MDSVVLGALLALTSTATETSTSALEAEIAEALAADRSAEVKDPNLSRPVPSISLLDISIDVLAAGGTSSAKEDSLRALQGGGHDPKNRGFTLQNVELTLSGVVDPYLRGDAHVILLITEEGETAIELEEAYLTTLSLFGGLQIRGGQFFTTFGRLNPMHPHAWDFVDQPVVNSRFMGPDGLRNPGLEISWLSPLPIYLEVTFSAQNSQGETAPSFRSSPGEELAGRPILESEVSSFLDLAHLGRALTAFEITDASTLLLGLSALVGNNASGEETRTEVYGVDLYFKWRPPDGDRGWPFVKLQTEAMFRRYQAGAIEAIDASGTALRVPEETLEDAGLYSQVVIGFARPWTIAARYDFARGEPSTFELPALEPRSYDSRTDPLRDTRHRASIAATYYPTEFSKLRLQYAFDRAEFLEERSAHSMYLQAEILLGAHGAHKF
jgi:hypothetical protein